MVAVDEENRVGARLQPIDPPRPLDAPARLADAGEPCPQLVEAHRCAGVGVHAHVVAEKPLLPVELVVRAATAVDVPVQVPAAVRHAGRLGDKGPGDRGLRPIFVVVAGHQVNLFACDLLPQPVGVLRGHLEREVAQDVELVVHADARVDVGDDHRIHLLDRFPRPVGELEHVFVPEVGIAGKPAGGVTNCGNVARHSKQTRSKRPKPQAYPLRNRLQKRF